MSRRRKRDKGDVGCLPNSLLAKAHMEIDALRQRVEETFPVPFSMTEMVEMCFDPDVLALLKQANPFVARLSSWDRSNTYSIGVGMTLTCNLYEINCLPPGRVELQPGAHRITEYVEEYRRRIGEPFTRAKRVVTYLNRLTTRSAFVYYFPAIRALVPDLGWEYTPNIKQPAGIGPMIGDIRAAAATIASALMLPAAEASESHGYLTVFCGPLDHGETSNLSLRTL